jgi:hypothetical protein
MIDLGSFIEMMKENYIKILAVGALVIAGNLFFKWLREETEETKVVV